MGSGVLEALGIRPAADLDLVVGSEVYARLVDEGWQQRTASNGAVGLQHNQFQVYDRWDDDGIIKNLEALLVDAEWIDGVAYNSLEKLVSSKVRRGREKDIEDVQRIRDYLAQSSAEGLV